jgi:hypothetical protein
MEKLITSNGSYNVYINRLPEIDEETFHLSFIDKNNKLHTFLMTCVNDNWQIKEDRSYDTWILALQPQLHRFIVKHLEQECSELSEAS